MPRFIKRRRAPRYAPYRRRTRQRRTVSGFVSKTALTRTQGSMPKLSVPRRIYGFPDTLVTKLKYSDLITLTSTANSLARYTFQINNLYDPDYSGTGHQPMFFDQYTPIYSRYVVLGAKLTASFSPIANTISTAQPSGSLVVGIFEDYDTSFVATNISWLMESNNSTTAFLNNANGGNNVKTMSAMYSPQQSLGVSPEDDVVSALVSTAAGPARGYYTNVFMTETGLGSPSSCNVKVDIEFTVRFFGQKDVAQS